jgi:hypothetical protein
LYTKIGLLFRLAHDRDAPETFLKPLGPLFVYKNWRTIAAGRGCCAQPAWSDDGGVAEDAVVPGPGSPGRLSLAPSVSRRATNTRGRPHGPRTEIVGSRSRGPLWELSRRGRSLSAEWTGGELGDAALPTPQFIRRCGGIARACAAKPGITGASADKRLLSSAYLPGLGLCSTCTWPRQ